jgi:Ca2+-binding RTX toxin-like protein
VDGKTYLYTASAMEHGISTWAVASNGNLRTMHDMSNADGLWIATPTAITSADIGGRTFLVLARAGTDSLTVLRADVDGILSIVDHLLNTRDTRFGDVAALEVVSHRGQTFVIAGGGDDGITVLQLLPDGQLVNRATIANSTSMTLDNVSAIAARGNGDSLDIFVTSSSETGVTRLRYDVGSAEQTLIALAKGGTLRGDGGSNVMTGGAGADIFVLAADGQRDTIRDFTLGTDRLDLSAWPMVRAKSQLDLF